MAVHMFTNRRIYDSILRRRRLCAQRGTCPVAKKAIFKNCESNQSVICLANANFGLAERLNLFKSGEMFLLVINRAGLFYVAEIRAGGGGLSAGDRCSVIR